MSRLFDERERAAESMYAHDEELAFLARRTGIQALARWAAEIMGLSTEASSSYATSLVDAFVSGTSDTALVERVQTDLERSGHPALSTNAGVTLAQAVAEATLALRGRNRGASQTEDPREAFERAHPKPDRSWGWGV